MVHESSVGQYYLHSILLQYLFPESQNYVVVNVAISQYVADTKSPVTTWRSFYFTFHSTVCVCSCICTYIYMLVHMGLCISGGLGHSQVVFFRANHNISWQRFSPWDMGLAEASRLTCEWEPEVFLAH